MSTVVERWNTRENQMIAVLTQPEGIVTITDGTSTNRQIPSFPELQKRVSSMTDDVSGTLADVQAVASQVVVLSNAAADSADAASSSASSAATETAASLTNQFSGEMDSRVNKSKGLINRGRRFNVFDYFPDDGVLVAQVQAGTIAAYTQIDTYVQRAVDALNATTYGGVLYFPRGTWRLSQQIWLKIAGSYIAGDGMQSTFLIFNDGDGTPAVRIAAPAWITKPASASRINYVGVEAITLSGRGGANGYANRTGLHLAGCGFEGKMRDVELHGWGLNATVGEDMWDWNIFGCKWTSNGNNVPAGTLLGRALSFRATADNSNAIKVVGCHFEGNTSGTLDISGRSNSIVFTNNKFERNGLGVGGVAVDEIFIDNGLSDGVVFGHNFASRDQITSYWMRIAGRGVLVTNNTLRGPSDTQGSLWFSVDPLGGGTRAVQARIAGNTIYAKGDLGKIPFDFRGLVKFHDNDVRITNPNLAFNIAYSGIEFRDNDITQLGAVTASPWLFTVGNAVVAEIRDNLYTNEYAKVGFDTSTYTDANGRLSSRMEFKSRGNVNSSNIAVTADGFDPMGYGDGYVFSVSVPLTSIKRDRLGKRIVLQLNNGASVANGSGMYLGAASRAAGWLTLQSVQISSRAGWQEVGWTPTV